MMAQFNQLCQAMKLNLERAIVDTEGKSSQDFVFLQGFLQNFRNVKILMKKLLCNRIFMGALNQYLV